MNIIRIIKIFICFVILMLSCSARANQLEIYLENLHNDIGQKKSAYAVSVTRTLNKNVANYLPLLQSKRFVIFSILNCFLGEQCIDNTNFEKQLTKHIDGEITEYKMIIEKLSKWKSNLLKDEKFLMENNKYNQSQIEKKANQIAQDKLGEGERELLAFWKKAVIFQNKKSNNEEELIEKKRGQLIQNYCSIYDKFKSQNPIKENRAIVVFNEMFFGKNAPFYKGIIESEVVENLSSINLNKIFHVNFLTIEDKTFLNIFDVKSFISDNKGDSWRFSTGSGKYNNYEDYIDKICAQYPLVSFVENELVVTGLHEQKLRVLENVSRIYLGGNEEAFYNKSSYQMEDDVSINNGAFYVFGDGIDKLSDDINKNNFIIETKERIKQLENIGSDCCCSEHLCNLYLKKKEILMPRLISTEICYDLELGVRYKYNFYPQNLRIHIVSSNTLTFREDLLSDNMKYLPTHSDLIFHVDPEDSALYKKVPTLSMLENYALKFHKIGDGMCSYIYQFELDESTYKIKAWSLNQLL